MSRSFRTELSFAQPPQTLLDLFTDGGFLEKECLSQGNFRASCHEVARSADSLSLRLDVVGPNRDPRTRAKEARSAVHYQWNLPSRSCTWHVSTEGSDAFRISGAHRIAEGPAGGCRYHMSWQVEVRVPVLGRVLEKKAQKSILEGARKREAFARRWLEEGRQS